MYECIKITVISLGMSRFEMFEGKRKGSTYYYSGTFLFILSKAVGEKKYLRCQDRTCRGTAVTEGNLLHLKKGHNHSRPTLQDIEDLKRLSRVKAAAESSLDGPTCSALYDNEVTWSETSSRGRATAKEVRNRGLSAMRQRRCRRRKADASHIDIDDTHNDTQIH